jgi:hypothetical protein
MATRDICGPRNPNWKGGKVRTVDGRVLVYCPGDTEARMYNGTHALRYRLVAREKLGRQLQDDEVVHHINGDPTDDRPENLEVTVQSAHARHHLNKRRDPATGQILAKGAVAGPSPNLRKTCVVCGAEFEAKRRHRMRQKTCRPECAQTLRTEGRYPHLRQERLSHV